jgi:HAD superfamily hydrolase (TIGR01509 family)
VASRLAPEFVRKAPSRARESQREVTIVAQMAPDLQEPRGLIFDLDGTLVDTVDARIDGWIEALGAFGIPATRDQVAPLIGMDGKSLAREVAGAAGRELDDDEVEEVDKAAGEAFDRRNAHPRPLPGAHAVLATLEELGLPWLIGTSSRAEQVRRSVASLGLERAPTIVDGSQVQRAKPAPDLLLRAAEGLQLPPADCWAIGDSTWDVRAAAAAGMPAVGVTVGSAVSAGALNEAGAALVVATLDELAAIVRRGRPTGR